MCDIKCIYEMISSFTVMIKGIKEGRTWLFFLQLPLAWLLPLCGIGSLETENTVMVPFLLLASSRLPDSLQEKVI